MIKILRRNKISLRIICGGLGSFKVLFVAIFTTVFFGFQENNTVSLDRLFNDIDKKMEEITSLQFNLKRTERFDGELITVENYIRFQAHPFKSMIQFLGEKKGDYLIYVPEENNGKALYIPGGFPFVNLSLDPESYLMRRTSHYTVKEIGVKFIVDQIKGNYLKWKDNFHYRGVARINNQDYHEIEGVLDELTYVQYQVKSGETLSQVSKKHFVSECMLVEINENIDEVDDDLEGETIRIPTCYANHILMHVNVKTLFPERILIEDKKGLFERYEYENIRINEAIDPNYFNEEYLEDI